MSSRTVAIVGAGIIGCLIARELAAADQDADITVLDRDLAGSGTTRRSAGLSLVKGSSARLATMSAFSDGYYTALKKTHPYLPISPVTAKLVLDAGQPADAGYLAPASPVTRGAGADQPAGPGGALFVLPPGASVWTLANCHIADVYSLTQALAAATRPGVRFREATEVTDLAESGAGVEIGTRSGERFTADQVVLAPGPWLNGPAWRGLVSPLGLRVKKIVAMHLERVPAPGDELVIFHAEDAFLLPMAHRGHWLFSFTRLEWDVDPDAIAGSPGLSPADVAAARDCLSPYSPELAGELVSGRVCCDAYSPSREPVVTPAGEHGRIVFAGAASGSGYRLAPAIASEAVDLLQRAWNEPSSLGATDDHQHV